MDCLGTYFTHAQSCGVTRVQSATQWTASIHILYMPRADVTRVASSPLEASFKKPFEGFKPPSSPTEAPFKPLQSPL